jgi:hypothetical protein
MNRAAELGRSTAVPSNDPFWNARRWPPALPQSGGKWWHLTLSRETVNPELLGRPEFPTISSTTYNCRRTRFQSSCYTDTRGLAAIYGRLAFEFLTLDAPLGTLNPLVGD